MPDPTPVQAYPGDETPDLRDILLEVKGGCAAHEQRRTRARELQDFFDGESERYVAFKPAEDALSWLTRPKRVSFITRQAVNKLTCHLYKPGPRKRRVAADPEVDAWYNRVAQDIHLNGVMQQADRLATLHGLCAVGVYPTGDPARPINYHLFPRHDFCAWVHDDDPRIAKAVCTVARVGPETVRYRLWTASHYYTFFKSKNWGYQPGGWNVAKFDPAASGAHPYGVLPFAFVTHELPTTHLETRGLGELLSKVNRALNIDKSNLALWVHHYARPLGFVSGVGPEWRPRFIDGGFVPLVVRHDSTEDAPVIPEARYLESNIDIQAIREYIRGEANEALSELDVPIQLDTIGGSGKGTSQASGVSVIAQNADLITYAKGRQPLFEVHETHLLQLVCRVAASAAGNLGAFATSLLAVAADPSLRVAWPEPQIDLPGPDRDAADLFELQSDLTDPIELLMRRQGLSEPEAIEAYRSVQRRKAAALAIQADWTAEVEAAPESEDDDPTGRTDDGDAAGDEVTPDMGVKAGDPPKEAPDQVNPHVTVTVAVPADMEIPAAPLLLPNVPMGAYGTET